MTQKLSYNERRDIKNKLSHESEATILIEALLCNKLSEVSDYDTDKMWDITSWIKASTNQCESIQLLLSDRVAMIYTSRKLHQLADLLDSLSKEGE